MRYVACFLIKRLDFTSNAELNLQCYRMKSSPRGLALIINNIEFLGDPDAKRNGAQYDSVNLENLFTQMGYKVILVENVKKDVSPNKLELTILIV